MNHGKKEGIAISDEDEEVFEEALDSPTEEDPPPPNPISTEHVFASMNLKDPILHACHSKGGNSRPTSSNNPYDVPNS